MIGNIYERVLVAVLVSEKIHGWIGRASVLCHNVKLMWFCIGFSSLLFCSLVYGEAPAADLASTYKLGPGDKIKIEVFDEPDLSLETQIADNGIISYPFIGEVNILGKTAHALETILTSKLKGAYLVNPVVTVSILEYRQFYVNGEVARSGGFAFSPGLTVRKAITLAGGFSERANKDRITVVRENDPGNSKPIELDDLVMPGDIITVARSFF